ncbi:PadR family transcriptional regulator [Halobacillus hunanensis]|uniref:PadR family transcriptional regulator n=1 Tax=Halobacillus hunanensis TaxID=578214 RepID=UPI0009A5D85B|nr:PadR family transcriptional regulator [Halobacillus hunanensis]
MSIQIVILGLLKSNDQHPYEIKKMIKENKWDQFFDMTDGNLYYSIESLKKKNYIQSIKTEKVEKRPNRTIYSITSEGHNHLINLIYEVFETQKMDGRSLYPALLFVDYVNLDKVSELITSWIVNLERVLDDNPPSGSELAAAIHSHYYGMLNFHLKWLKNVQDIIRERISD